MFEIMQYFFGLGCQNTPGKKSRFCAEHEDSACSLRDDWSTMMGEPAVDVKRDEEIDVLPVKVLNERETRQRKFYEVNSYVHYMS